MPARLSPARRAAFLTALTQTGNQAIAAERARVSGTWVRDHRRTDPDFRAACDAAIATARARLATATSAEPAAGWRTQGGEELVVRGTKGRQLQVARARLTQWTPRTEARFLAALAACCNVRAACRAVGMTPAAAYNHYERWVDFSRRWEEALAEGYIRLEMALFENAGRAFAPVDYPPDIPIEPMSFDQALSLLRFHQQRVHGFGKPTRLKQKPRRTADEVFESLAHKLDRVAKMQQRAEFGDPAASRDAIDRGARIVRGTREPR